MKQLFNISIVLACMLLLSACKNIHKEIQFPKVNDNIPYSSIESLPTLDATNAVSYASHQDQYFYFWEAINPSSDFIPKQQDTVIFVHGGCWLSAFDIGHSQAFTSGLAAAGYNVFSIEYRRTGNGGEWPVALDDLKLAILNIRRFMRSKGITSQQVTMVGHSAGGHLATLLAVDAINVFENLNLIGLAAIIDLPRYALGDNSCQTATPKFMQGDEQEQATAYKLANPLNYTMLGLNSAIMYSGSKDNIVPTSLATHPNTENQILPGVGHFDWIHPGSFAFKTLIQRLEAINENRVITPLDVKNTDAD
ncbi:alpha/beta hydrolase [Glaciecola petra]|uniref:Alpha/beta hydrolase n=1 Tax=Glaciecola petra TaxID=3075602 RepID=A0ABU2ZLQ6_9ALTE|nr:alpha/beta hydrolase [Aestuariibacter sp. P117]MDT0593563.1 alpha/beta hydrolase [Aestuariibacter sp. P117]